MYKGLSSSFAPTIKRIQANKLTHSLCCVITSDGTELNYSARTRSTPEAKFGDGPLLKDTSPVLRNYITLESNEAQYSTI